MNHTNTPAPIGAHARSSFIRWYAGFLLSDEMHAAHVWDNNHIPAQAWRAALASAAQPASAEPLARYCPGCGSVGPVESNYRDCCPDGNEARMIPQALAQKCRDTFKLALDGLLTQQAQRDERLWCVNVHGPGDVHAMPSRAAALERANELNECFGRHPYEEGDPIMRAVVIEWPHAADLHATALYKRAMADAARAAKEGGAP